MSKNSVLEELRVRRLAVIQLEMTVMKSVLKVRNASVKVEWVEREEELSIICVKVVVEGKGKYKSTERCSIHDEE